MKKITIKRRRRITKHGKGTTKGTTNPRKSSRRINPRKHKTRRQSAGGLVFGWESFIDAEKNITSKGGKGIDVKVKLENGKPTWWLIGGNDKTFRELGNGAKDGRYVDFIDALKIYISLSELNFTNPGRDNDSSKGIKLSHDQFCRLFIQGPLDYYPVLTDRFKQRRYECSSAAPMSAVRAPMSAAPRVAPPMSAVRAPRVAPTQIYPPPPGPQYQYLPLPDPQYQYPPPPGPQYQYLPPPDPQYQYLPPPGPSAAQQYATPPPPPSSAPAQHVQRPSLSEQTIQILMDGRFTREVVMSALNQTNNDVEAAIDLLNLPPTQVVQEAYPVTSDLKNPDTFVKNYVRTNHIELLPQPVYAPDQRRNLNAFPGFDGWKVIQTVGDGNCLTHAFLQCLSPTYGKIKDGGGYKNKYNVALEFRKVFSQTSYLARNKNTYSDGNYTGFLTDEEITDYSRLFNLITVVFENQVGQTFINASNFSINSTPTDRVLFIHGDGGHYSSVMLPNGQFTMTLAEARQIPGLHQSLTI